MLVGGASLFADDITLADFYVAPNGNDSWSGKLAEPNADRSDGRWPRWPARAMPCEN